MAGFRQVSMTEFREKITEGSELRLEMGNDEFRVVAKVKVVTKYRTFAQVEILEVLEQGSSVTYKASDEIEVFCNQLYMEVDDGQKTN